MQPDIIRQSLLDIVESIDSIEGYLSEFMGDRRDFNIFMQKKHLRRSVERELEIIGKIIATRNYVAHGYDKIDHETIWYIVTKQLSKLRAEVRQLLG